MKGVTDASGAVVFFGRFVAVLRAWAAFLAGTNRMRWPRFLVFNVAGGIVWSTVYGLGGYLLGDNIHRFTGPVGLALVVVAAVVIVAFVIYLRRNEQRLEDEAERALPGPLDAHRRRDRHDGHGGGRDVARQVGVTHGEGEEVKG